MPKKNLSDAQVKRLAELEKGLGVKRRHSDEEFEEGLQECLSQGLILLQMKLAGGSTSSTGAILNIIEKTYWILDSIRSKGIEKSDEDPYTVNVFFKSSSDKNS